MIQPSISVKGLLFKGIKVSADGCSKADCSGEWDRFEGDVACVACVRLSSMPTRFAGSFSG